MLNYLFIRNNGCESEIDKKSFTTEKEFKNYVDVVRDMGNFENWGFYPLGEPSLVGLIKADFIHLSEEEEDIIRKYEEEIR